MTVSSNWRNFKQFLDFYNQVVINLMTISRRQYCNSKESPQFLSVIRLWYYGLPFLLSSIIGYGNYNI